VREETRFLLRVSLQKEIRSGIVTFGGKSILEKLNGIPVLAADSICFQILRTGT